MCNLLLCRKIINFHLIIWFGFESRSTRLSGVYDVYWFGTSIEKSKPRNNVVPINLPTASADNSKCYDVLIDTCRNHAGAP